MRVKLNIEEDDELRNYIKSCIDQQVLSIVRDDMVSVMKNEFVRKYKAMSDNGYNFRRQQELAFESAAKQIILRNNGISDWSDDFIKPLANKIIDERVQIAVDGIDWQKSIDNAASEKLKSLISKT